MKVDKTKNYRIVKKNRFGVAYLYLNGTYHPTSFKVIPGNEIVKTLDAEIKKHEKHHDQFVYCEPINWIK